MGLLRKRPAAADEDVLVVVEKSADPHLVILHDPRGIGAEQIRGLRNALVSLNPERASRSVVLTSAARGEGKSVSTLNLAVALTELRDTRVVVVDADFRSPAIEALLGLPRRPGLAELLEGRLPIDRAVRESFVRNLAVIGAGEAGESPGERLASGRLKSVLDALKESFHYVLLDTPPALAYTDASVAARVADGVVLVVRLESTPRDRVEQTISLLTSLGANVLGTLLTGARVPPEVGRVYADADA